MIAVGHRPGFRRYGGRHRDQRPQLHPAGMPGPVRIVPQGSAGRDHARGGSGPANTASTSASTGGVDRNDTSSAVSRNTPPASCTRVRITPRH